MGGERNNADDWILDIAERLFEGEATREELDRLERELLTNPASRRRFLRFAQINAKLGLTDRGLLASCGNVKADAELPAAHLDGCHGQRPTEVGRGFVVPASAGNRFPFAKFFDCLWEGPLAQRAISASRRYYERTAESLRSLAVAPIPDASPASKQLRTGTRLTRRRAIGLGAGLAVALLVAVVWNGARPQVEFVRGVGQELAELVNSPPLQGGAGGGAPQEDRAQESGVRSQKSESPGEPGGVSPAKLPPLGRGGRGGRATEHLASHQDLVGHRFELTSGLVELNFHKASANVVIEAPARFLVEDAKTLRVEFGRVAAHVRDGVQGLRVLTPDMDVLDLGTRFAIDVAEENRSEIHVLEGKVEAGVLHSGSRQALAARESLRFEHAQSPAPCDLRNGTFVQPEEIASLAAAVRAGRPERSRHAAAKLKTDSALLAFVDFDPAHDAGFVEHGGEIVGARAVQGRFPGETAVEFVDPTDHVKLNLDQRVNQLTLMTWVRLNQVLARANSLYSADGWNARGQVHWQINNVDPFRDRMRFSINGAPIEDEQRHGEARWAVSRATLTKELGRWVHLAVVYDAVSQRAELFINGRRDSASEIPESIPALLGPAQIGNWKPAPTMPLRRLSGRMDEFVALSRALSSAEIQTYFEDTNPYSHE